VTFRRVTRGQVHWYELDGRKIPGVTTIIRQGVPKPALPGWAAREVAEFAADNLGILTNLDRDATVDLLKGAPWRDRDRAAHRGKEVHRLAEQLVSGEEVEVPQELAGHVDSYLRWRDDWGPDNELAELSICNATWRYGGTLDLLCQLKPWPGEWTLVDFKTGRSGIYGEVALQMSGYAHAEFYLDQADRQWPMPEIQHYMAVWLRTDGYDCYPVDVGEREWKVLLWARQVGLWLEERSERNAPAPALGSALYREAVS
jgi:hypothetical protein